MYVHEIMRYDCHLILAKQWRPTTDYKKLRITVYTIHAYVQIYTKTLCFTAPHVRNV